MLVLCLVSTIVYVALVPFNSPTASFIHYIRTSVIVFLLCLVMGTFPVIEQGLDLYHSLFTYSSFTLSIDSLLYLIAALVLVSFSPVSARTGIKAEYSLILMFSVLGASIMISANDMISIYVALELQSFGLYLLACLRTEETGSTHASLKYFLLGAISSAFILLGISIIYQEVGSTQFQTISSFLLAQDYSRGVSNTTLVMGILSMLCGFMFKISAAPFHSWFADVIQGVPTYTSMIIINLPKISIFTFLFNMFLSLALVDQSWTMFMVLVTLFSLVLGTVAGLMQTKIKRLLAFSTISHVGFILIGLTTQSEVSISAIIFYLVQYTLTVVLTFLVLVTYETSHVLGISKKISAINYIQDLQGVANNYKLLTFTLVLCLFSMAGIPPLTGFYAKLGVLHASIMQNINIVFLTAIVCSIISAAYYLKVIRVLMFKESSSTSTGDGNAYPTISPVHSYAMSIITAFLCLFILDSKIIINCTELVALSIYLQ